MGPFGREMGIYFDNTTDKEDANYIIQGIKDKEITEDFYWSEDLVWVADPDHGVVIINGVKGNLTSRGVAYIMQCLFKEGRISTSLEWF